MIREIRPDWLLRQANDLTGSGVGQPRHGDLRRATSAAYYALFHQITFATATQLLPGCSDIEIQRATRSISHQSIRTVTDWIAGATPPKPLADAVHRLQANPELAEVAQAFQELHEERERADYDYELDLSRSGVRATIETSRRVTRLLSSRSASLDYQIFYGLIALRNNVQSR